jgi:hypothetical protein
MQLTVGKRARIGWRLQILPSLFRPGCLTAPGAAAAVAASRVWSLMPLIAQLLAKFIAPHNRLHRQGRGRTKHRKGGTSLRGRGGRACSVGLAAEVRELERPAAPPDHSASFFRHFSLKLYV